MGYFDMSLIRAIQGWLLVVAVLPVLCVAEEAPLVLENELLRVEFSAKDGSITRLRNKRADLELISAAVKSPKPWAMVLTPFDFVSDFTAFHATPESEDNGQRLALRWETPYKITIKAEARLAAGSDELELRCAAENTGDRIILALRYPALQGIGTLTDDGTQDRLLHSTMMGAVFSDPFHLFKAEDPILQARGMVVSHYPNGFGGSALQLMAYYAEGRGGFYVAAKDSRCTDKDFNFYKTADGLTCEIAHLQWDARKGKSLVIDYPIVIAAMTEGTWYEAAERYRTWAVEQPWCERGTRKERVAAEDASRWLLEEIGAVGIWWPFRNDIRADILRTRELFGAPLLHLELWWSHGPSLEAAHSEGDRFGPFYFPSLAQKGKDAFETHQGDRILPAVTPIDSQWIAMCPAQPGWRELTCEVAEDMVGEGPLRHHQIWVGENETGCQADCLYYDIGPCAGVPTHCHTPGHVHPPGAGREITQAYVTLFEETQQRASKVKGAYVPIGTECVTEPFVGCLDLYFARNAGFSPDMEVFPYVRDLTWLPDGKMEIVPLFPFVYHQYGPVAVQGIHPVSPWNVPEADDCFTWAEARSVLWGGLLATTRVVPDGNVSAERVRFLRSLAAARTDFANEYLAYGRMQRSPVVECAPIVLDHGLAEGGWLRKLRFEPPGPDPQTSIVEYEKPAGEQKPSEELSIEHWLEGILAIPATPAKTATIQVPSVVSQAYTLGDDRLGILLVNLQSGSEQTVQLTVDPVSCGLPTGTYQLRQVTMDAQKDLDTFDDRHEIRVALPPREVVLLWAQVYHGNLEIPPKP